MSAVPQKYNNRAMVCHRFRCHPFFLDSQRLFSSLSMHFFYLLRCDIANGKSLANHLFFFRALSLLLNFTCEMKTHDVEMAVSNVSSLKNVCVAVSSLSMSTVYFILLCIFMKKMTISTSELTVETNEKKYTFHVFCRLLSHLCAKQNAVNCHTKTK